jgi:ABC-type glycerol-3-phosphate transport system permease component
MSKIIVDRLVRWFMFSVLIALIPILFNFIGVILDNQPISTARLFGKGELLLIAVAISGRGMGELIPSGMNRAIVKIIVIGSNLIIISLASYGFAYTSAKISSGASPDPTTIARVSIGLFLSALIASGCCIWLKKED